KALVDFDIDNDGLIVQAGGDLSIGNSFGGGSTFRNLAGGVYEFRGDGGVVNGSGNNSTPHHFDNAGTIRKTAGNGTSRLTMFSLNNAGRIEAQTGTIQLGGERGVVNTGTLVVAAGAAIDLTGGGNIAYKGGFSGSGQGHVLLQSGAINANQ